MTTTCADIIAQARALSILNTPLTADNTEMLRRIRADQQALFSGLASVTRDRYQATASVTSTAGGTGRTFSLASLAVERVLQLTLADGREVSQVDAMDIDAELAPRYFVRGTSLVEVGSDWGTPGAKTATLVYVQGATDIDPGGSLGQTVSVPDGWADLLVLPLGMYLFQKDPGREAGEYERLAAQLAARQEAFVAYLTNYGGVESRRFDQPSPLASSRKD